MDAANVAVLLTSSIVKFISNDTLIHAAMLSLKIEFQCSMQIANAHVVLHIFKS